MPRVVVKQSNKQHSRSHYDVGNGDAAAYAGSEMQAIARSVSVFDPPPNTVSLNLPNPSVLRNKVFNVVISVIAGLDHGELTLNLMLPTQEIPPFMVALSYSYDVIALGRDSTIVNVRLPNNSLVASRIFGPMPRSSDIGPGVFQVVPFAPPLFAPTALSFYVNP